MEMQSKGKWRGKLENGAPRKFRIGSFSQTRFHAGVTLSRRPLSGLQGPNQGPMHSLRDLLAFSRFHTIFGLKHKCKGRVLSHFSLAESATLFQIEFSHLFAKFIVDKWTSFMGDSVVLRIIEYRIKRPLKCETKAEMFLNMCGQFFFPEFRRFFPQNVRKRSPAFAS